MDNSIKFQDYHLPALPDGLYRAELSISHNLEYNGSFAVSKLHFYVAGERFSIPSTLIFYCFPPRQALGTYDNVLPHIELNRSTLPWERDTGATDKNIPWLMLLLLDESEFGNPTKVVVKQQAAAELRDNLGLTVEPGEPPKGDSSINESCPMVSTLCIDSELLQSIFPDAESLKFLTHVCISHDRDANLQERPNLICNRLPKPQSRSQVHLVSLEGRLNADGSFKLENGKTPFCSLYSWEFTCLATEEDGHHGGTFSGLCNQLDFSPFRFTLPYSSSDDTSSITKSYFDIGSLPLPHTLRGGGKTISWYRGPLTPVDMGFSRNLHIDFPVLSADELIKYHVSSDMLDVSLAAAWELGRLVTLSDTNMSANMQRWKLAHAQEVAHAEQTLVHSHLPFMERSFGSEADSALSQALSNYFLDLQLLKGVPFVYLVPDKSYLPNESIRFFEVDPVWCQALMDGAFSVGRSMQLAVNAEKNSGRTLPNAAQYPVMSGVLLRSDLVAGWPSLQIDGYDVQIDSQDSMPAKELLTTVAYSDGIKDAFDAENIPDGIVNAINQALKTWNKTKPDQYPPALSSDLSIEQVAPTAWRVADNDNLAYFLLQLDGKNLNIYDEYQLPILRFERLSKNILFVLFQGVAKTIDIHLPEEALHSGFEPEEKGVYSKRVKDADGNTTQQAVTVSLSKERRVDIGALKKALGDDSSNDMTAGMFGMELIQGVPRKRFVMSNDPPRKPVTTQTRGQRV